MVTHSYVNANGVTVHVLRPRKARGSSTFGQRAPRVISQWAREGSGARYLYGKAGSR